MIWKGQGHSSALYYVPLLCQNVHPNQVPFTKDVMWIAVVGTYLECGHNGSSKYPRVQIPISILLGNSNVFSGQKRCIIAPGYFESDLWSSSNWTYPDPPESWWHLCWMPKPLQLVPFNMKDQWFYSLIKPASLTLT